MDGFIIAWLEASGETALLLMTHPARWGSDEIIHCRGIDAVTHRNRSVLLPGETRTSADDDTHRGHQLFPPQASKGVGNLADMRAQGWID